MDFRVSVVGFQGLRLRVYPEVKPLFEAPTAVSLEEAEAREETRSRAKIQILKPPNIPKSLIPKPLTPSPGLGLTG